MSLPDTAEYWQDVKGPRPKSRVVICRVCSAPVRRDRIHHHLQKVHQIPLPGYDKSYPSLSDLFPPRHPGTGTVCLPVHNQPKECAMARSSSYLIDFGNEVIKPVLVSGGTPDDGPVRFLTRLPVFGPSKAGPGKTPHMKLEVGIIIQNLDPEGNPLRGHGFAGKTLYFIWPGTYKGGKNDKMTNDLAAGKLKTFLMLSCGLNAQQAKVDPENPKDLAKLEGLTGYAWYTNGAPKKAGQKEMSQENFDVVNVLTEAQYNDACDGIFSLPSVKPAEKLEETEEEVEETEEEVQDPDDDDAGTADTDDTAEPEDEPEDVEPEPEPVRRGPGRPARAPAAAPVTPAAPRSAPTVAPPRAPAANAARNILNRGSR